MNAIEIFMNEHREIERMIKVIRKMCFKLYNEKNIDFDDFHTAVNFIKTFADGHHHHKEELYLFNEMVNELGKLGEKTIKHGMLVEHDMARLYVQNLIEALGMFKDGNEESVLDVIGNAIAYCDLLTRHINKEDNVIYTFAQRQLKKETMEKVDKLSMEYEKENSLIRDENIAIIEVLERKYN